jgi:hypothetical protein
MCYTSESADKFLELISMILRGSDLLVINLGVVIEVGSSSMRHFSYVCTSLQYIFKFMSNRSKPLWLALSALGWLQVSLLAQNSLGWLNLRANWNWAAQSQAPIFWIGIQVLQVFSISLHTYLCYSNSNWCEEVRSYYTWCRVHEIDIYMHPYKKDGEENHLVTCVRRCLPIGVMGVIHVLSLFNMMILARIALYFSILVMFIWTI